MHILIIGAAGMLGRKLLEKIAIEKTVLGCDIDKMTLVDVIRPTAPSALQSIASCSEVDLSEPGAARRLIDGRPDVIFHLAAIVSGEAEEHFEKGYTVNLDGTRALFEAIRLIGASQRYFPRVIFASSVAVFGSPFPDKIGDDFFTTPLTSYGTQKAIAELLLADYSRKGIFDGIGLRLPTICIRPGRPNAAASGFFSNILREPLAGIEAILPVDDDVRHWFASPRSAIGFLVHAAKLDLASVGTRRNLMMPGLSATVGEQVAALTRVAGPKVAKLIRRQPDPKISKIVAGWPADFDPQRSLSLGFTSEKNFDTIIRIHIDDELGGLIAL